MPIQGREWPTLIGYITHIKVGITSKFLLVYPLCHMLHYPWKIVREIEILIFSQSPLHNLQQLSLSRIISFPHFGLNFAKPHFNRVQLGWVRRQIQNIHLTILCQLLGLLPVMDGTVVKNKPFLPQTVLSTFILVHLVHVLSDSGEEVPDEIKELVFSVGAFYNSPVGKAIFSNNCNQWKPFALVDGAVHVDFLIWPWPSFISGHVKVKAALIKKKYFCSLHVDVVVHRTILLSLFKWFRGISFFWNTFYSFLLEPSHL